MSSDEERAGVGMTNLDQPLFDGAQATKRDLVDYLEAVADQLVGQLRDRPLSVVRVRPGQERFMQKNLPKYAPEWVPRVTTWAASAQRTITYSVCQDLRTLLWFGNQRAVEYHPTLLTTDPEVGQTHLVLDLDPSPGQTFRHAVLAAQLIRTALAADGLSAAVKTSGAKGVHVFVPLRPGIPLEDAAAATRAVAARGGRRRPPRRPHPGKPPAPAGAPPPPPRALGVTSCMRLSERSTVDLPQPEGPMKAVTLRGSTVSETSATAWNLP